ncbi:DUF86 domain-containing protein [Heliorestis acidaminivorans]|uniref:DUF86 domain-containing protein n=1 Tax=Heliorestis acidaminivorans TaxID=553427 RepID=A0A6I0EYR1_9FIRM|nr:DUF86 domain-containing protein [Heliorestis acidaminivorans]KAB2951922.1 DUF86 domain-containing protein [Heliorestis acidaminivorans]
MIINQRDRIYLVHMLDSIEKIESYLQIISQEEFYQSTQLQDAVIRRLEIIGEAANKVSREFQQRHTTIPWSMIISMRNMLIHEYFGVDLDIVWDTYVYNIPELKKNLVCLLNERQIE